GFRAVKRAASTEAIRYYRDALAAIERLPEGRLRTEQSIDVHLRLRSPHWTLGQFDAVRTTLQEAERLSLAIDDRRRAGRAALYQVNLLWITGQYREWQRRRPEVQAFAEAADDADLQLYALTQLGQQATTTGDVR